LARLSVSSWIRPKSKRHRMMIASKSMVVGSMIAAGVVAAASVMDLVFKFPFSGQILMDVMFLIGAGLVGYMGYDAYQDLS